MKKLASKIAGWLINKVPDSVHLPIIGGHLRGYQWTISSGHLGHWLGHYESYCQAVFVNCVKRDHVVYDVGANVGFFTLLAASLSGDGGKIFSFEPIPGNQRRLRRNIEINNLKSVVVMPVCLGQSSGIVRFSAARSSAQHKMKVDGDIEVRMESINDLVAGGMPAPDFVKIDVEGAESDVLEGMSTLLSAGVPPNILVEVHGYKQQAKCRELLEQFGYSIRVIGNHGSWLVDFHAKHKSSR